MYECNEDPDASPRRRWTMMRTVSRQWRFWSIAWRVVGHRRHDEKGQLSSLSAGLGWKLAPRSIARIAATAICSFGLPVVASAASSATASDFDTNATTPLISIAIGSSRAQPTAGTGLAINAQIKNLSSRTVYLQSQSLTLEVPPELQGPFASLEDATYYAYFPTEAGFDSAGKSKTPYNAKVALRAGDSYRVFFGIKPSLKTIPESGSAERGRKLESPSTLVEVATNVLNEVGTELNFMFFSPGDYEITVSARYWIDPKLPEDDSRTTVQSTILHVAAPQFVILFGAALGGLIAYFILPGARRRLVELPFRLETRLTYVSYAVERTLREAAGIVGAVLLSTLVTILVSRISETQFLIRVTVTDLWGAIAIGFFANYSGTRLIDRLLGSTGQTTGGTPAPGAPQPGSDATRGSGEGQVQVTN